MMANIYLVPKDSKDLILPKHSETHIFYKLHDSEVLFDLGELFIGPDQKLAAKLTDDDVKITLVEPIHLLYNISGFKNQGFIRF